MLLSNSEMIVIIIQSFFSHPYLLGCFIQGVESTSTLSVWSIVIFSPLSHSNNGLLDGSFFNFLIFLFIFQELFLLVHHLSCWEASWFGIYLYGPVYCQLCRDPDLSAEGEHPKEHIDLIDKIGKENLSIGQVQPSRECILKGWVKDDLSIGRMHGEKSFEFFPHTWGFSCEDHSERSEVGLIHGS